jgi:hypothetical protein
MTGWCTIITFINNVNQQLKKKHHVFKTTILKLLCNKVQNDFVDKRSFLISPKMSSDKLYCRQKQFMAKMIDLFFLSLIYHVFNHSIYMYLQ